MTAVPSPAVRAAAWESERTRKIAASPIMAQYDRGLLTLDEFIAALAGVRIDERGWAHPGPTFPEPTVYILTQVFAEERASERAGLIELEREARR